MKPNKWIRSWQALASGGVCWCIHAAGISQKKCGTSTGTIAIYEIDRFFRTNLSLNDA